MLCSNALESNAREACAIIYIYIYIYIDALSTELKCMQETAIRETKGVLIREVSSFLGVLERGGSTAHTVNGRKRQYTYYTLGITSILHGCP